MTSNSAIAAARAIVKLSEQLGQTVTDEVRETAQQAFTSPRKTADGQARHLPFESAYEKFVVALKEASVEFSAGSAIQLDGVLVSMKNPRPLKTEVAIQAAKPDGQAVSED